MDKISFLFFIYIDISLTPEMRGTHEARWQSGRGWEWQEVKVRVGRKAISGSLFATQVMRLVGWHILSGITPSGLFLCTINPGMVRTGSRPRDEEVW